jgi:uncharacterized protein YdaT
MDSKELRNLHEAYLDVYEQDEILDEAEVMKHQKERSAIERRKKMKGYEPPTKGVHGEIERRQAQKPPSKLRSGSLPESYDLYDIILSHLIDEGYAETEDEAESIMVNMSEEWREDILAEAITSEKGKKKAAEMIAARSTASGRAKSGKGANVAQIRQIRGSGRGDFDREGLGGTPMTPTMAKNPIKKQNYTGTGNKAARRAGLTPTRENPNAWKEEVETWVNSLIEEGYDLSSYTWEEMYEMYVTEGDNYDKNRQRAAKRAAERNAARDAGKTGNVPGVGYVTSRRERETYRDSGGVERHTSGARMPK